MKPNIGQGDNGTTSLLGGKKKIPKDSLQVEICGTLDELVSFLGFVKTKCRYKNTCALLEKIQDHLFRLASYVAASPPLTKEEEGSDGAALPSVTSEHVKFLESIIQKYERDLPELQNFILPGGTELVSLFHIARTQARRVERRLVKASRKMRLHPCAVPYVNRLSDVFFTLARWANHKANVQDIKWIGLGKKGI